MSQAKILWLKCHYYLRCSCAWFGHVACASGGGEDVAHCLVCLELKDMKKKKRVSLHLEEDPNPLTLPLKLVSLSLESW